MSPTPTILVVDDEAVNRAIATAVLAAAGWQVDSVETARAAIAAVQKADYALVLMDIQMPDMDGFDATQAIRAGDGPASVVPIIAFTALRRAEAAVRMRETRMDGYVAKPFTPEALTSAVEPWRPDGEYKAAERLSAIFGAAEIDGLLGRFRDQLDEALDVAEDGDARRLRAHKIAGIAGTLGFPEVSRTWMAVAEGFDSSWCAARIAARKALAVLAARRASWPQA
jgi:CheY-like chemotaxis protein